MTSADADGDAGIIGLALSVRRAKGNTSLETHPHEDT